MNHTPRITLDSSGMDAMLVMAEGNPGAASVIGLLMSDSQGIIDLCHLDDAQIYGSDIWIGYKDVCGSELSVFKEELRSRTLKEKIKARAQVL